MGLINDSVLCSYMTYIYHYNYYMKMNASITNFLVVSNNRNLYAKMAVSGSGLERVRQNKLVFV